jgi:ABC-type multidrug transport system fused ATPase/permease subunit
MDIADEILVLRQGTIVERGSHQQLLQNEDLYWRMWQQQQRLQANISQ